MRKTLLLSATLVGFAATAMAQPTDAPGGATPGTAPPAPSSDAIPTPAAPPRTQPHRAARPAAAQGSGIRPGHVPGVGQSYPLSSRASNITQGDTRSVIAPTLPAPAGGPNASVHQFLSDAQQALNTNQTGKAQEALERAETAMLQRSVPLSEADTPDQAPDVQQVKAARDALANRDVAGAKRGVAAAMSAGS